MFHHPHGKKFPIWKHADMLFQIYFLFHVEIAFLKNLSTETHLFPAFLLEIHGEVLLLFTRGRRAKAEFKKKKGAIRFFKIERAIEMNSCGLVI